MIQLMTFEEFESKTSLNIRELTPEILSEANKIMSKIGEGLTASIFTQAVHTRGSVQEELNQLSASREASKNKHNSCIMVYERLSTHSGIISWTYYKLVKFDTSDLQRIKKLLKITKLKAFL